MFEIKRVPAEHQQAFFRLIRGAYPDWKMRDQKHFEEIAQEDLQSMSGDPQRHNFGYYRDGALLGAMRFFDFEMNAFGSKVPTGGIGMVAVDLLHKKQKIAKEMLHFFLQYYRERSFPFAILYPFRPDFYRKMGFGFATQVNRYAVPPEQFPNRFPGSELSFATPADLEDVFGCYDRYCEQTHGMVYRTNYEKEQHRKYFQNQVVLYRKEGELKGYLTFHFEKQEGYTGFGKNNMVVSELVPLDREALWVFCSFFHSQKDQVHRVIIDTQDENLHHMFNDPRDGSDFLIPFLSHQTNLQGSGLMYRVLDVADWMERSKARVFGRQTLTLGLQVDDSFLPENAFHGTLHFENGRLLRVDQSQATIQLSMDIATFSAWIMGVVPLKPLFTYGQVEVSDEVYLGVLDELFHV
ncbi:MAG TPA: GNAT family N-acetyltransferase, partial [Thermotogota bacterium]|nr:GNAT family N-acetyltransferase [Thermotogota bacterium]